MGEVRECQRQSTSRLKQHPNNPTWRVLRVPSRSWDHYIFATHQMPTFILLTFVPQGKRSSSRYLVRDWLLFSPQKSAPIEGWLQYNSSGTLLGSHCSTYSPTLMATSFPNGSLRATLDARWTLDRWSLEYRTSTSTQYLDDCDVSYS